MCASVGSGMWQRSTTPDYPLTAFRDAANAREVDTADDPAAVLGWRLEARGRHSTGTGPLPWLPEHHHSDYHPLAAAVELGELHSDRITTAPRETERIDWRRARLVHEIDRFVVLTVPVPCPEAHTHTEPSIESSTTSQNSPP